MLRTRDGRRLGVAAFAVLACSLAAGAFTASAQVPQPPPVLPPGYPQPPTPPAPGQIVGCFSTTPSLNLMAGESATVTFTCQALPGGQVSLRVTETPAGVTAT